MSAEPLYGGETRKAIENFRISGEPVPSAVIHWLGRIKGAAAEVNGELGLLDGELAQRIAAGAREVAEAKHDDQFPIDVFQTGSGTSTNMNANEVIAASPARRARQRPRQPRPVLERRLPLGRPPCGTRAGVAELLPALAALEASLSAKAEAFHDIVKTGRTHLMDAVPVTLGQEFSGYAAQIRLGRRRVESALPRVAQIPLGGTAVGTGLNTHPEFAAQGSRPSARRDEAPIEPPEDPFESQGNRDALVELSGALKVLAVSLTKIAATISR
jgi:fumarate hydratase class II